MLWLEALNGEFKTFVSCYKKGKWFFFGLTSKTRNERFVSEKLQEFLLEIFLGENLIQFYENNKSFCGIPGIKNWGWEIFGGLSDRVKNLECSAFFWKWAKVFCKEVRKILGKEIWNFWNNFNWMGASFLEQLWGWKFIGILVVKLRGIRGGKLRGILEEKWRKSGEKNWEHFRRKI